MLWRIFFDFKFTLLIYFVRAGLPNPRPAKSIVEAYQRICNYIIDQIIVMLRINPMTRKKIGINRLIFVPIEIFRFI